MKKKFVSLFVSISFLAFPQQKEDEFIKEFHSINSDEVNSYVIELCRPEYDGRLAGSPGYDKAADFVASKLKEWGIKPLGDNGSYFQNFPRPYTTTHNPGSLELLLINSITGDTLIKKYKPVDEYFPGSNSDSGQVVGEVVYVGYGITALELNYDDYKGVDVNGKIVMFNSEAPTDFDNPEYDKWLPYSLHQYKYKNAFEHGAKGIVYIGTIANPSAIFQKGMIYCHISPTIVNDLFYGTGFEFKAIEECIRKTLKPNSINLKKIVRINTSTHHHPNTKTSNVIGLIEGSDPILKNEVVIVGGHLDGQGNPGILLPSGFDNASGVADIMGAAKALATLKERPKRSIMFIFIGAEDCGLLGSKYYCQNPNFPFEKTTCFINLDMVGNGTGLAVWGGESYPNLYKHFFDGNEKFIHRTMNTSQMRKSRGRPRSDSYVFFEKGIPVMSLGTTNAVKPVYYHHPMDTADMVTPETMEDAAKLLYLGLIGIANM